MGCFLYSRDWKFQILRTLFRRVCGLSKSLTLLITLYNRNVSLYMDTLQPAWKVFFFFYYGNCALWHSWQRRRCPKVITLGGVLGAKRSALLFIFFSISLLLSFYDTVRLWDFPYLLPKPLPHTEFPCSMAIAHMPFSFPPFCSLRFFRVTGGRKITTLYDTDMTK